MKVNERKQLREKTVSELDLMARDAEKTLFKMRNNKTVGEVEKTHLYVELRRNIARIRTIIREKEKTAAAK